MKKRHQFRRGIATTLAILTTVSQAQIPVFAEVNTASAAGEIKVNPQIHYQTLEGWGTSLCWWGNVIGSAGDRDYNGNGKPDREEIAELAFSPEYLNLNIVRYNVGGGDKADSSIKRVEGKVPGWSKDMFGNEDGSGEFLGEEFYQKAAADMNDAGQIWMLEQANRWRADEGDIINEVFSNSPPYYMTKSGSSTGGNDWNGWEKENLKDDCYDDFALYMARATKWLDQHLSSEFGTNVDYVEPLNEPDTNYWLNGSTKQEGCIFYPGSSQIKAYQAMKTALEQEGLTDVRMTGTDETSLDKAIHSYRQLDTQTRGNLDVISAHTYGGDDMDRQELRDIAASYDKKLWMSEVTKGGGNTHNEWSHGDMGQCQANHQSEGIMSDLKKMQSSAWIAWLVADSEYECIQTNQNWGLLHYVFEEDGPVPGYHTNLFDGNGNVKGDVPGAGYWAVTKQFYTMMQYSKYLKAGYTMIEIGDDNMCAAISPDRKELVIVGQYFGDGTRETSIDLSSFPNATDVKLYRTSSALSCEEQEASLSGNTLNVSLPEWSVSTYVITGDGNPLYDESSYQVVVSSNVEATEDSLAAGATDDNKFTYTGAWSSGWEWDTQEKYTTNRDSYATFKFDGVQAEFYGKTSGNGAELLISVDGGEEVPVSAYTPNEIRRNHLYTTPVLADGTHTVTIRMAENQTAGGPEIVLEYAKITRGEIKVIDPEYTKEALVANDYVLYTVNCGTPDPSVIPNTDSERMGLLQSHVDQAYGADAATGKQWGCDPDTEYSKVKKEGNDATDIGNSFIYMADDITFDKDKSQLGYSFELPQKKLEGIDSDTVEVTVAFKHWWENRPVDVCLEGREVESDIWVDNGNWVSKTYRTDVTDGVLNVQVKNPDRESPSQDPILNYIKVRAVQETFSISGTVRAPQDVVVADLEVKLYQAEGAEPIGTVKTNADGSYVFGNLDAGTYRVELPAVGGYESISRNVEVKDGNVNDINFTLGSEDVPYTKEELVANDYVLYTVNCGTPDPKVLPNSNSERWGLLQSNMDQPYGADEVTGMEWGCNLDTEYSKALKNGSDASDIGNSFIYMAEDAAFDKYKSSLGYSFELPQGMLDGIDPEAYEVTVAFKHYWDTRWLNIALEGKSVVTDMEVAYDSWVAKTFTTEVTDGILNVDIRSPRRSSSKQDPILNYIKVRAVEAYEPEVPVYDSFTGVAGEPMYDTNGKMIQAHGGQIQQLTVDGETKWYWIGEDKTNDYRPVGGIHVYSSTDLYNWDDEGVVLETMESPEQFETDPYFEALYGDYSKEKQAEIFVDLDKNNSVMERPKMIYNEKNDNYVIWFHADGRTPDSDADYGKAKAGIAVSDSPTGPFKLLGSYKLNYHDDPNADHGYDGWNGRGSVRDMNLFVDDDKTAYVIYSSEGNKTTFISRLNEDYTDLEVPREEAVEGEHFTRNFIGWSREAPAMFKYNNKYYIINSGCTGWSPNPAQYAVADHPMGPWTAMGDPCSGWESDTTFRTQSTCVIPVDAENGKYIYMGDRWNAGYLRDSRYVWLPIEFQEGNRIALYRYENWTLDELNGKGLARITSEIPTEFESLEALKLALPDTVDVNIGGEEFEDAAVVWDEIDTTRPYAGTYTVNGTLTGHDNKGVSHEAAIVDGNTLYFFDSGADSSEYLDVLGNVADLRNEETDQAYTEDNHAGYTGEKDEDFGKHIGSGMFGNGWWAKENKAIEYRFDLEPGEYSVTTGYQEWWTVERYMKVSAVLQEENGQETILDEKDFTLGAYEPGMVQTLDITVPETEGNSSVLVRVEKTSGSDPVLSFIGIAAKKAADTRFSISGTVTSELENVQAEGIELKLYEGDDIHLASPSDAVSTDAEGAYTFDGLKNGTYSVELPAADGYQTEVKKVVVADKDVKDVDFTLKREEEEPTVYSISGTVTSEMEDVQAEGIELRLYKGDDISLASPSDAAWTDEAGDYVFDGLESGVYSVELPAADGYEAAVETVVIEDADVNGIDFTLVGEEEDPDPDPVPERRIAVTALPEKQKYMVGEELDPTGLEVTLYLDDEAERVLEEDEYSISELNSSAAGMKKIWISYEEDQKTYKTSFQVMVYEAAEDSSIKVVRKPDKLVYYAGEALDLSGIEVRGRNIGGEDIVIFTGDEFEAEYDFEEAGTAVVTILYTMDEETTGLMLKDTFEVLVLEADVDTYVKSLRITEEPFQRAYEVGDEFDPDGMVVERTVAAAEIATSSNATYTETVPLDELDLEVEEFNKTGTKKVTVSLEAEGEDGALVTLSDTTAVTVTRNGDVMVEGLLDAAMERLERVLGYGDYLTAEERQEAFAQAVGDMADSLDSYEDVGVSSRIFGKLKDLEEKILEANPQITSSVDADSWFGNVYAEGLALSADMEADGYQDMKLKVKRSGEKLPSNIQREVTASVSMEISLHNGAEELQPKLPIKIRMAIPKGVEKKNLVIYHLHDGAWSTIIPTISGTQMSFTVSDLSVFVAANTKTRVSGSSSGSGSSIRFNTGYVKSGPGYTTPGTWKQDATGWWFEKTDGTFIRSAWAMINGQWYYFNEHGYMMTGQILVDGKTYFLNTDGSLVTKEETSAKTNAQ